MIHTHKLNRLSEEETDILLYCINDGNIETPKIDRTSLSWVRLEYAFRMLNEYASKVVGDKRTQLQQIADKITNP
jgi:hypothetical protein